MSARSTPSPSVAARAWRKLPRFNSFSQSHPLMDPGTSSDTISALNISIAGCYILGHLILSPRLSGDDFIPAKGKRPTALKSYHPAQRSSFFMLRAPGRLVLCFIANPRSTLL